MNDEHTLQFNKILEKLRHPEKRTWIILNPTSIGDTALMCAFAKAFVETHGYGITMVVPEDHIPITQMYPGRFEQVLVADRETMHQMMNAYLPTHQFALDMPFCGHPYDLGDGRADELGYLFKFPGRGGLSFVDIFRHVLRLPWDAQIERPKIPEEWAREANEFAISASMEYHNSVILFPANSSPIAQFPDILWSTLVARLKANGYKVFCNMKGGNFRPQTMPIAGAIPIEIPVHLSLPLVSIAGRTISGSNGMQFLQMLGGRFENMTVMFPVSSQFGDFEMNGRIYSPTNPISQYMCPELCVDVSFAEYAVPHDGAEAELIQIATAVADLSENDPYCFCRMVGNGSYIDENADWLRPLVEPLAVEN
ncbi:MAG TPA: hypothetical protein VNX00_04450 [Herbaspirillum sp.]|nr:hypothetical protein [Herbaspirillum sp.]